MAMTPSRAKFRLNAMLVLVFVSSPPANTLDDNAVAIAIQTNFRLLILNTYKKIGCKGKKIVLNEY
jgi:hypothetical protein